MKKAAITLLLGAAVLAGCSSKGGSVSIVRAASQDSSSCEEAVKEYFTAMYTKDSGGIFYDYMFPDEVIGTMEKNGRYSGMVKTFNDSQKKNLSKDDGEYSFGKIVSEKEITADQTDSIKRYFVSISAPYAEIKAEELGITEGYELTYDYLKNGSKAGEQNVFAVKLSGEGWKIITQ